MNIRNTKKLVKTCMKKEVTPIIWGAAGIGKSDLIRQICSEEKIGFVDLRLGQMESGDVIGMPERQGDKTIWLKPSWFPTEGKGVLFLDELNRARQDILQSIFQLVLDRKLNTHVLPKDWGIVVAQNPSGTEEYTVNELDKALLSRFVHIKLTPEPQEWLIWAKENEVDESIVDFVGKYPETLGYESISLPKIKPNGRSWEMLNKLKKNLPEEILTEVCFGILGSEFAITYIESLKANMKRPVRGKEILKEYDKHRNRLKDYVKANRFDLLSISVDDTVATLKKARKFKKEHEERNVITLMKDLPRDLSFALVRSLVDSEIMETDYFMDKLSQYDEIQEKLSQIQKV